MKIAITGGTGFVGRYLARELVALGHEAVLISRGMDRRDPSVMEITGTTFLPIGTSDVSSLANAFEGCRAVAHLSGINRELGSQTYEAIHVEATANVIEAMHRRGVSKLILLSFLQARPNCGSPYHESKWASEELVRSSGLDYTIFKSGVIYGLGDHMLDHISHALYTFPVFLLVGFKPKPIRPLAVEDLVSVMVASLLKGRLSCSSVAITGPEEMDLKELATRVARVCKKHPLIIPAPIWIHYFMAWFFERTMVVPLTSSAQVKILSESLAVPYREKDRLPEDLQPLSFFTDEKIFQGLPEQGTFGKKDCLRNSRISNH